MKSKKEMIKRKALIFIAFTIGLYIILNTIFVGYPSIIVRGVFTEFTKHDFIAKKEMLGYLSEKYNESFEVVDLDSPFLETDYIGRVAPSSNKSEIFTVIGTPIKNANLHYKYIDNYMKIKWKKEVGTDIDPLLNKYLSSKSYGEIELPNLTDYSLYDNTTLPFKTFQKMQPNIAEINIVLVYILNKRKEKEYISEVNQFIIQLKKSEIKNISLELYLIDAQHFKSTKEVKSLIKKSGVYPFLSEYSFGIIKQAQFDIHQNYNLNQILGG